MSLDDMITQARRHELEEFERAKTATQARRKLEQRAGREHEKQMDPPWVEFEDLSADDWWERGVSHVRRKYYGDVSELARETIDETMHGHVDDLHDYIHELVDSNQWVIYTNLAMKVMWVSENESVGLSEGLVTMDGDDIPWSQLAYCAMEQDIGEAIVRLGPEKGFDFHDPTDCPECGESWEDHTWDNVDNIICPSDEDEDEDDEEDDDDDDPA